MAYILSIMECVSVRRYLQLAFGKRELGSIKYDTMQVFWYILLHSGACVCHHANGPSVCSLCSACVGRHVPKHHRRKPVRGVSAGHVPAQVAADGLHRVPAGHHHRTGEEAPPDGRGRQASLEQRLGAIKMGEGMGIGTGCRGWE